MPQASLLSYFGKPVTGVVPLHETTGRSGHIASENDACPVLQPPQGQGVVDPARTHEAQNFARRNGCAIEVSKQKTQTTTPVIRKEVEDLTSQSEAASSSEPNPVKAITIPHLPTATISPVSEDHLQAIRRLTATTLPVRFSEAFFKTAVTDPVAQQLSRVIIYDSEPVGWIRCRLEPCSPRSSFGAKTTQSFSQIYVQALALLSPYRNLGLATILLNEILSSAESLPEDPVCIYAHVWQKNEDALDWYARRGFKRIMLVERYYTRLRPSGAWLVRKELHDV